MMLILFKLLLAHWIVDVHYQPEEVAKGKNPHSPPPKAYDPKVHGPRQTVWPYYMAAHAAMNAAAVGLVTGRPDVAACEFGLHFGIDLVKSDCRLSIHWDQAMHVICKVLYAAYLSGFSL